MSGRDYFDGDGTPDSPMVVPSDESTGDGENSPQPRNNDREAAQDGAYHEDEQATSNAGTDEQGTAATDTQPVASAPRTLLPAVRILPAPAPTANSTAAQTQVVHILPTPAPSANPTANPASNGSGPAPADIPGFDPTTVTAGLPAHMRSIGNIVPPGVNQALKCNRETLVPHASDPTKITAKFRVEVPGRTGEYYEQTDAIPVRDESVVSSRDPKYYFIPDLTVSKLQKKIRENKKNAQAPNQWVRQGTSYTWVRKDPKGGPDQVFDLTIMFRRLNATTHKYEEMYLNLKMLINPDPNTKTWMYAYNKWIDQIRRRRDAMYNQVHHKDHWSVAERRALCEAINAYIRKSGLVRFGSGATVQIPQADMQDMADAVNKVGTYKRKPDAVRGQIFSSHVKKNKAIFDLVNLAKDIRERVASGEILPRDMRYPTEAIPRHAFPKDLTPLKRRGAGDKDADARKRRADLMDDGRPDHSDPPADDVPLPGCMQDFLNGNPATGIRPSKKVKFMTESGDELPDDEQWAETDEEILSEGAERARSEVALESVSGAYDSVEEASDDEDVEEREHQDANDMRSAIHNSYNRRAVPSSVGIQIPGEEDSDDSDSDSEDDEPTSAAASSGKTAKGRQRAQAAAGPATPSPPQKRRYSRDDENDASEGDDESDMGTPQGRSIKKARTKPSK
ncbi:hypothetical protein HBI24_019360 [Parastagonospora nodorum]|nr:hypothetical protein HBI24_019360 [Parastagonospora nodorum]